MKSLTSGELQPGILALLLSYLFLSFSNFFPWPLPKMIAPLNFKWRVQVCTRDLFARTPSVRIMVTLFTRNIQIYVDIRLSRIIWYCKCCNLIIITFLYCSPLLICPSGERDAVKPFRPIGSPLELSIPSAVQVHITTRCRFCREQHWVPHFVRPVQSGGGGIARWILSDLNAAIN